MREKLIFKQNFLRDYNVWGRSKQNAAMYFNNYVHYQPIPCEVVEAKKTDPVQLSEAEQKSILKLQRMRQKEEGVNNPKLVDMDEQQAKQKEIKKQFLTSKLVKH